MKTILSLFIFLFTVTAHADNPTVEKLLAAYGEPTEQNPNLRKMFIYSKNELVNLYISVNNQYYAALSHGKQGDFHVYSTSVVFQPYLGKANLVSAMLKDKNLGIVETIETSQDAKTLALTAKSADQVVKTAEQLAAEAAEAAKQAQLQAQQAAASGDGYGFVAAVNQARAAQSAADRIPRSMLSYDANLSAWAARNSAAGYGHKVMAGAMQGVAMAGHPLSALSQWRGSGTHNSYLMTPGATRIGIGGNSNGSIWTFNIN